MKQGTIPRVELPRKQHQIPPYQIGHWVLAGTPSNQPYPCTCRYDPCRYFRCPDRYRAEGDALPWGCCGRAGHTREADAGRLAAETAGRTPGFVAPGRGTSWERRFPTAAGASVAESASEAGLWDTGQGEPPPAWDAVDEASGSHGEALEAAFAHSDIHGAYEGAGEDAEERWRTELQQRRAGVAAAQCECPTPWDARAPALLWADDPEAVAASRTQELSAKPGADVRAEADAALELAGDQRAKPWKQGRHALLPGEGGTKTRGCWIAPLASGAVAVIDLPPEPRGGGVHCGDCCRDFGNAGAWEMHRKRDRQGRSTCVDPAQVWLVPPSGDMISSNDISSARQGDRTPLLKRTIGGVWSVDPIAVWGQQGPPLTPEAAQQLWARAQQELSGRRWQYGRGHNRAPR